MNAFIKMSKAFHVKLFSCVDYTRYPPIYYRSISIKTLVSIHSEYPWELVSENSRLTMEMVRKYPDKPWNWWRMSRNPNLTMEMIEKYPDKPWNLMCVLSNPMKKSFHY